MKKSVVGLFRKTAQNDFNDFSAGLTRSSDNPAKAISSVSQFPPNKLEKKLSGSALAKKMCFRVKLAVVLQTSSRSYNVEDLA